MGTFSRKDASVGCSWCMRTDRPVFGHQAHDVFLSVLCRAAEQGYHIQPTVFFP